MLATRGFLTEASNEKCGGMLLGRKPKTTTTKPTFNFMENRFENEELKKNFFKLHLLTPF